MIILSKMNSNKIKEAITFLDYNKIDYDFVIEGHPINNNKNVKLRILKILNDRYMEEDNIGFDIDVSSISSSTLIQFKLLFGGG